MGAWEELKTFIQQGNIVTLAVAFVIGLAFSAVVMAFVADIITPIISIPGKVDFSSLSLDINGSHLLYGLFFNAVLSFVVIAIVIFFAIVRPMAKREERRKAKLGPAAVVTKECPYCISTIALKATKCPNCTSNLA